jgi:hypothetical protein
VSSQELFKIQIHLHAILASHYILVGVLGNVAAVDETFRNFFVAVNEHLRG